MLACMLLILFLFDPAPPSFSPQWKPGQEYLYRGAIKETSQGQGIQLLSHYLLELRVLVLNVKSNSADVVCCTKLTQQNASKTQPVVSAYLTHAVIDQQGKITSSSAPTGIPLNVDGPATWETGFILPLPSQLPEAGKKWEMAESGRLPRRFSWMPMSDSSFEVCGDQESIDWQRPRADSTAWRRTDKLLFASKATLPTKIERLIERRAPAHQHVTSRIVTEYELIWQETLSGPMLEERQRDIQQLRRLQDEVNALAVTMLERNSRDAWQRLANKLAKYQTASGSTPYREALTTMSSTVQAGMENRLSLQQVKHEVPERSIQIGQLVPHFSLRTSSGATITSHQCLGKPTLLVFVQPGSDLCKSLTAEIPALQQRYHETTFNCLILTSRDALDGMPAIAECKNALMASVNGKPLLATFGVTTTPHFALLGSDGTLLATHIGWGPETRQLLLSQIRQELAKMRR